MNSIKHLLISQIFKSVLIIFLSTIFLLNIAFYLFSNNQYQKEIERQYNALYNMTAHLATEDDAQTLIIYLEHYTHTNEVIISFTDEMDVTLFSNDEENRLDQYEEVFYSEILVGYLAVNFESSKLGMDMLYGFIGLNLISITLFALGMIILYQFLRNESMKIKQELAHIGENSTVFSYQEIKQIHTQLIKNQEQKEKQRMIYESHIKSLAHDIKTPLSVIRIYTDSLIGKQILPSKDIFIEMQEETKKISDLIPRFIELDYIELPYLQDISLFIGNYMNKYKDIFDSKKISIETKLEPLKLNVSDKDLERLIEHLTFNAFYYSKPQSTVKITTQNENRHLVIQDEGIGMSRETIEMILKGPFRSKEAIVLNEKGSGIGFQIIKEIVEKLGATLQIESVIGQGTQIIIHF